MPSSNKDYYAALGVDRSSDHASIKSAYKKLAVKYHPDKNPGDTAAEEKFKEAAEAYGVLGDEAKRKEYDLGVSDIVHGFADFGFPFTNSRKPDRKNFRGPRGTNLQVIIELTLKEIYDGANKTVNYSHHDRCETCNGFGSDNHDTVECDACNGMGRIMSTTSLGISMIRRVQECSQCMGSGAKLKSPCKTCTGTGRTMKRRSIKVPVSKGMDTAIQLIMRNGGHSGPNLGPFGDLIVKFSLKSDDHFTRQGNDLHTDIIVPMSRAILGGKVETRTMSSKHHIDITPGTRHGDTYRVKDFGLPIPDSDDFGDMIAHISIEIPSRLTDEQRIAVSKLKEVGL